MANPITARMAAKRAGLQDAAAAVTAKPGKLSFYQEQLKKDQAQLKKLATIPEKNAAKLSRLDTYLVFVADYIDSGQNYRNSLVVQIMIWLFDVLNIEKALELAFVLIGQGQVMPDSFGRDMPTFVCDAVYDWANDLLKKNQSAGPYLDQLVEKLPDWQNEFDLHPAVVSKCYVMLAKHKNSEGDYKAVVELCDQAIAANPEGHGCKTLKEKAAALMPAE